MDLKLAEYQTLVDRSKRKILSNHCVKITYKSIYFMAYSAALPIITDPNDGYRMLKTIENLAKQNLKMLLYTEPSERVFDSNFGVGIKRYLFQQNLEVTYEDIRQKINNQVRTYLPYITIQKINFYNNFDGGENLSETNNLKIEILFSVDGLANVNRILLG
jgi:phage baseplate assembly protein W